ncbi:hypothetical protein C2G38_2038830 [Gigaspora rosea]|uniref:Uncharacterized protein n=1 Tax=Gigaspora rosea TaxID=44941 RepID=A0A397V452_9GLOM|nr:hypothetical protein C2G38_2038830 [Gigaspora rosea]
MASDEREVCQSFDGSGNTVLSSQTHHSFENNMSLTESAELNELNSEALYETTVSDSLNLNLNPSQEVEKKLDRYAMEREFAVRKLRTCTHDDGTVWNATWVCHLSGQWKSKKIIDPDNQRNRDINIANCKWHCNFSISNQATRVRCSLLN